MYEVHAPQNKMNISTNRTNKIVFSNNITVETIAYYVGIRVCLIQQPWMPQSYTYN